MNDKKLLKQIAGNTKPVPDTTSDSGGRLRRQMVNLVVPGNTYWTVPESEEWEIIGMASYNRPACDGRSGLNVLFLGGIQVAFVGGALAINDLCYEYWGVGGDTLAVAYPAGIPNWHNRYCLPILWLSPGDQVGFEFATAGAPANSDVSVMLLYRSHQARRDTE